MNEDINFQNVESWRGSNDKFGLTFKQIILMHINRCVINNSGKWHGSYYNSIRQLRALLLAYFDKEIQKADGEIQKSFEQLEEKYKDTEDKKEIRNYSLKKVELSIKLFEELIKLLKRINFFEEIE